MKALSLTQPWATLVMLGAKQWETRSWATNHRGSLAIHASKGFPAYARQLIQQDPFRRVLQAAGFDVDDIHHALPFGAILGTVELDHVILVDPLRILPELLTPQELAFGDYSVGRYGWNLSNPKPFPVPIPCKGALGLWNWNSTLTPAVSSALATQLKLL